MDPILPPDENPDPLDGLVNGCLVVIFFGAVVILSILWLQWS